MLTLEKTCRCVRRLIVGLPLLAGITVPAVTALAGPQAEIINPTMNFGRVTQGKVVTTDFFVKSIGNEPLKITTLWSGCGCTEIPLTDSIIKPGDSLQLRIKFSTGQMQGVVVKHPTVQTSASEEVIKLSIMAEVLIKPDDGYPVVLLPDVVDVAQFGQKTRRIGTFSLTNKSSEDLRLMVVDSALKSFKVKVPAVVKAGQTIEGKVRVIDKMREKDFEESVTFRLEGKESYYYTLPVVRTYRPMN